ncbi:MAG: TetR/AcrR family transcriptional regulator [Proteobacteria bacterium]|nr:TetR/AcrR family transcriptional regulator [Pseudomonadota bacterium]
MNEIASDSGQRGPAEHAIRNQIVAAAGEHFSRYGYGKTTVADLAAAIGFSKAYIYKFFDSKQAIGEAICAASLSSIVQHAEDVIADAKTPTEQIRRLFSTVVTDIARLAFNDRKVYDLAAAACAEKWPPTVVYMDSLRELVARIITEGRRTGEFERKTALDETSRAIVGAMLTFLSPVTLQYNLDAVPQLPNEIVAMVLRSLAP